MGIGAIIGTGIFVLTGVASATRAGPSLTISFVIAGIVSALAALCYAEVSSKSPDLRKRVHVHVRDDGRVLRMDRRLGAGARIRARRVDRQRRLVGLLHVHPAHASTSGIFRRRGSTATGTPTPGIANLPAAGIIFLITALLVRGTRESGTVNAVIVAIKVADRALLHRDRHRSHQRGELSSSRRGLKRAPAATSRSAGAAMLGGAAFIFFAYIGFDAVSTTAEEAQKSRPRFAVRHHREPGDLHGSLHRRRRDSRTASCRSTNSTSPFRSRSQ